MKTSLPFSHYLTIILCTFLSTCKVSCLAVNPPSQYITRSCQTTLYPQLCNATLAKYAIKIKTNPKILALTALLVTFNATQSTSKVLSSLSKNRALKPGEKAALIECVEVVGDSVYELQKSVKELNQSRRGPEFALQMDDVQTWVSAALTDEDTCMDDFTTRGTMQIFVRRLVLRVARFTSIALTFVNNYAAV